MLNSLAKEVYTLAVEKGWWDSPRSFLEIAGLIHSEISEAVEEWRDDAPALYFKSGKPEGIGIELADAIIRILDYCYFAGIDIEAAIKLKHDYNKTRPHRHGGKKA